jgi:hypothetical protein
LQLVSIGHRDLEIVSVEAWYLYWGMAPLIDEMYVDALMGKSKLIICAI